MSHGCNQKTAQGSNRRHTPVYETHRPTHRLQVYRTITMVRLLLLSDLLYGAVNPPLPTQSHISVMAASRPEEPCRQVLQIGGAVIHVDIRIGQGVRGMKTSSHGCAG